MKVGSEIRMKEAKFMKLNLCRYHCKLCNWGVPVFVPGLQGHKQYKPIQTVLQHASALGILNYFNTTNTTNLLRMCNVIMTMSL